MAGQLGQRPRRQSNVALFNSSNAPDDLPTGSAAEPSRSRLVAAWSTCRLIRSGSVIESTRSGWPERTTWPTTPRSSGTRPLDAQGRAADSVLVAVPERCSPDREQAWPPRPLLERGPPRGRGSTGWRSQHCLKNWLSRRRSPARRVSTIRRPRRTTSKRWSTPPGVRLGAQRPPRRALRPDGQTHVPERQPARGTHQRFRSMARSPAAGTLTWSQAGRPLMAEAKNPAAPRGQARQSRTTGLGSPTDCLFARVDEQSGRHRGQFWPLDEPCVARRLVSAHGLSLKTAIGKESRILTRSTPAHCIHFASIAHPDRYQSDSGGSAEAVTQRPRSVAAGRSASGDGRQPRVFSPKLPVLAGLTFCGVDQTGVK